MPIEYCCYNGDQHEKCLKWLEHNLPDVFATLPTNNSNDIHNEEPKVTTIQREPIVVVADFSACVRDGRFASIGSIDEIKKYVVKNK